MKLLWLENLVEVDPSHPGHLPLWEYLAWLSATGFPCLVVTRGALPPEHPYTMDSSVSPRRAMHILRHIIAITHTAG